jgi:hypothetical protein
MRCCKGFGLGAQAMMVLPNGSSGITAVGANSFAVRMITEPRSRCDNHNGIGRLVRRIPVVVGTRGARRMNSLLLKPATHSNRRLGINA